ncbi:MAG TPA: hypothetical protein VLA25_07695 [Methylotenera sp.]|nr:hypothetical protein [Methylotenera sp.]
MTSDNSNLQGKAEAAIQQINLGYNAQQDRLLLKVGLADNSELVVWLTYRITKQLWQLLNGETHLPTATSINVETPPQQATALFKQEAEASETLEKMDFATEYQPRAEIVNDGAMLAASVVIIPRPNKPSSLEMPCLEGITVRMNLNQELVLALCNMLQLSAKEASWDLGTGLAMAVQAQSDALFAANPEAKKVLH